MKHGFLAEVQVAFPDLEWAESWGSHSWYYEAKAAGKTLVITINPLGSRLCIFDTLEPDESSVSSKVIGGLGYLISDLAKLLTEAQR